MTTTYEDLRERFINGESNVTAAELDKARRDAEFEGLQAEAAEAAAGRAAEAQRQQDLEDLRAKAAELQSKGTGHLRKAYADAVAAGHTLRAALEQHRADVTRLNAVNIKHGAHEDLPEDYDIQHYLKAATEEIIAGHAISPHRLSPEA